MRDSTNVAPDRTADRPAQRPSHVGLAVLGVIGVTLVVMAVLGTYESSVATATAAHDRSPGGLLKFLEYLPVSTAPIGPLREPLMDARRAALRAGFDRDDAPIDAFQRLRRVPGHEQEARSLLAEYWERKALAAESPLRRALYALQARVVDDDDSRRRAAESAIAALGPLRRARHVFEGAILSSDAHTLVMRGSGWLHVLDRDTGGSFDLSDSQAASAIVDGRRMVTWGDGVARIWGLDRAPTQPLASFKLLPGEVPLAFAGVSSASSARGCILTSAGRVWGADDSPEPVDVARGRWTTGSLAASCDSLVLRGDRLAAYHRVRAKTWRAEPFRQADHGALFGPLSRAPSGKGDSALKIDACATRAARCVLAEPSGVRSLWEFDAAPRRLLDGIDCEVARMSPSGNRLLCRETRDGTTLYSEDEDGNWTRADAVLPAMSGGVLQDDGVLCAAIPWSDAPSADRSDVMTLAPQPCGPAGMSERGLRSIRMLPGGTGAVFTYGSSAEGASESAGLFGFDTRGESMAGASNAWFGEKTDERLLEHDATNSAEDDRYELGGRTLDPSAAFDPGDHASSVAIEDAVFVEGAEPSVILALGYIEPTAHGRVPARAVARWDLHAGRFCGKAIPGALTSVAPGGTAVAVDGRVYRLGACAAGRGFEPSGATGAVAVGPGATRWIEKGEDLLYLRGLHGSAAGAPVVPTGGKVRRIAFSPSGDQFFVQTDTGLCTWEVRDDHAIDLTGCRWSAGGWASDAAWAAGDTSGATIAVFDRTSEGAAVRELFGSAEAELPIETGGNVACKAIPRSTESASAVLEQWEERLGHRFREQGAPLQDTGEMVSSEIVPMDSPGR
jgi:hypothetical protein